MSQSENGKSRLHWTNGWMKQKEFAAASTKINRWGLLDADVKIGSLCLHNGWANICFSCTHWQSSFNVCPWRLSSDGVDFSSPVVSDNKTIHTDPPHTLTYSYIQHLRQIFNHKLYWVIRNRWLRLNRNTKTEITTTTQEAHPRLHLWVHLREEHFQFTIKWHEWVCWTPGRDVEKNFRCVIRIHLKSLHIN